MVFDVIIVGAGPGGSSAATFLAAQGISTLLLDKATFPRDKVCGDCLAPQALYWLDELGCVDEVLDQADSCITAGYIFLNGKYLFTGDFPQNTRYPGFCTLLERKKLDYIMVKNAVKKGAIFKPGCLVKRIYRNDDYIIVDAVSEGTDIQFKGRLLIGADGANSIVSRSIGNVLRDGTTAVSVRAYYENVHGEWPQIQVYIDERFFPGIGWVFVNNRGRANIGIGYIFDKNFPVKDNLRKVFDDFVNRDLKRYLKGSRPASPTAGWWASFFRPRTVIADRVMLIGDAANLADPINGAGIHKAMESAYIASTSAVHAVATDDYSVAALRRYEALWREMDGFDWQVRQLLLSIAKNPNLKEVYLLLIKYIARLARADARFQGFCGGVFSGIIPAGDSISPAALLDAIPLDPAVWFSLFRASDRSVSLPVHDTILAGLNVIKTVGRFASNPSENIDWGVEVFNNAIGTASGIMQLPLLAAGIET
ncbi:MAG: NAD(P)/FAD-dependent oxidoreductase [Nitrospinae bacterium]|nr:NAD(P)/FAD-dependent oxidoreductase [Nitrospinota bacterium]